MALEVLQRPSKDPRRDQLLETCGIVADKRIGLARDHAAAIGVEDDR
jgi:hypothetical protein